jgi:peptide deformylase
MATTTLSSNHQSLQILKTLSWKDLDDLSKMSSETKLVLDDPIFIHALGTTLQSFCQMRKGYSLSSLMLGYNSNFLVASSNGNKFRFFYDLKYEKMGDEAQSLEACISSLDQLGKPRRFYCYRCQKIRISGKELVNAELVNVKEEVTGVFSAVLQHEIENQNFNFLPYYGVEVQVY